MHILAPPSIFTSTRVVTIVTLSSNLPILSCIPADIGSVGVRKVGVLCPLLSALLVVSNTRFKPLFASRVATTLIPVSLWLGSRAVGLKYWRTPVFKCLKNKQLLKNNGTYSPTFTVVLLHKARNIHYYCFSWNSQLTFNGSTSTSPLTTPTKSHPHK